MLRLGLVLVSMFMFACDGSSASITIPTLPGKVKLHFDPTKIQEQRLRQLTRVGPYESWIPPSLDMCISGDPEYRDCGSRKPDAPNFAHNAQVNLVRGKKMATSLDRLDIPRQLDPVVAYLRREITFYVCLHQSQFDYYRGNVGALRTPCGEIDPRRACPHVVSGTPLARVDRERYEFAIYDWGNCMNAVFRSEVGDYPLKTWQAFLRAYGVREEFIDEYSD